MAFKEISYLQLHLIDNQTEYIFLQNLLGFIDNNDSNDNTTYNNNITNNNIMSLIM